MQRRSQEDITFTTPEVSFAADVTSPQALIRRFLETNLPAFPSISGIEESVDINDDDSMDSSIAEIGGRAVSRKDQARGVDTFVDNNSGVDSSSISLSLPESFDIGILRGTAPASGPLTVTILL